MTDGADMQETVDAAMCAISATEVPDLNTTYGENLLMTNDIAKDKYVSAVMPCAVLKMCTYLVESMQQSTLQHSTLHGRNISVTRETTC